MDLQYAVDVLIKERICVQRVECSDKLCDRERECAKCDLAMSSEDIIEAYNMAISALHKQQPMYVLCKKGWQGMRDTRFQCPVCNRVVRTWGEEWCNGCGQRLKRPKQEIIDNQIVLVWDTDHKEER